VVEVRQGEEVEVVLAVRDASDELDFAAAVDACGLFDQPSRLRRASLLLLLGFRV
jgi:hypothetical protein